MQRKLLATNNEWAGLIARLTLALIIFPHGAQKMLGWFKGFGFSGTMGYFTGTLDLPWIIAFLIIVIEFIGSLLLLVGLTTRVWSVLLIILMAGIIFTSHLDNGFFMNWFGDHKGEGYEFHLLVIGLSVICLINGGGRYSVDQLITRQ